MKFASKWKTAYFWLYRQSSFVSKAAAFAIVFAAASSLIELLVNLDGAGSFWVDNRGKILVAIGLHLWVCLCFLIRFGLLFFRRERFFWLSQFFWLLGVSGLIFYYLFTGQFYSRNSECMDCMYADTYLYASPTFAVVAGILYVWLTFIKQVSYWIISFGLSFRKDRFDV